ncbi:hypothetical protein RDABS01_027577 [Bienertia sinuspersici]
MASNMYNKLRKSHVSSSSNFKLCITLFFTVIFTIPALFLLQNNPSSLCFPQLSTTIRSTKSWAGDLRSATFSWNHLDLTGPKSGPQPLKIAVFTRKWPIGSIPGGMERHAYTLHTALANRGHRIHVFTSPYDQGPNPSLSSTANPTIHFHEGEPGKWRYNKAWEQFTEENQQEAFDVIHTESVALPHGVARHLTNLVVTWHGIALESLQSSIYQDLARQPDEPMSPAFNQSIQGVVPKVLNEIRFFHHYKHHVAISDSVGEMLRDVYQIPSKRVHVIINGVNEGDFKEEVKLGQDFRSKIGLPKNATLVIGVAGRLVKDKGHPLVHRAFSKFIEDHPNVYLIVAGSGPWENRYRELGPQVLVLGPMKPAQLGAFYNAIDIFLNPTLRPQGLDLTLMEAMLSGTPVMASRFPSIKGTIVVEEEFGFMFAPNVEALLEVLEEVASEGPKRLADRGKSCKDYALSMFTAHKMALAYERLFLCVRNETFCQYP